MKTKNYYICEAVRGSSKFYFMEGKMNDKGKKINFQIKMKLHLNFWRQRNLK